MSLQLRLFGGGQPAADKLVNNFGNHAIDKTKHKEHRKYEGAVAENELGKKRADVGLAKKLHSMRPGYARLGLGIDKADSDARTRIDVIKAKLTGGTN